MDSFAATPNPEDQDDQIDQTNQLNQPAQPAQPDQPLNPGQPTYSDPALDLNLNTPPAAPAQPAAANPAVSLAGPSLPSQEQPLYDPQSALPPEYQVAEDPTLPAQSPQSPDLQTPPFNPDPSTGEAAPPPPPPGSQVEGSTEDPPKKSKKITFIIIGIALIILLTAGLFLFNKFFNNAPTVTGDPVRLTYWGLWDGPQIMQPLIDEYQEQNPHVTIEYEQRPIGDHYAAVRARISGRSVAGNTTPDIIRLHNSWIPSLRTYLSPIPANVFGPNAYRQEQYPVTQDTLLHDDNFYGLPLSIDGLALVYNKDLFNQANITTPPQTWDDVRQAAAKIVTLNQRGDVTTGGIAMGTANNVDHFPEIVGLLFAQNGVDTVDQTGSLSFANTLSPDGQNLGAEALAFYTLFSTTEKSWDDKMESSSQAFSKEDVGMILVPSWRVLSLIEQNPQLNIGVTTAPQLVADRQVSYATYWVETVPEASPNKNEAWKFVTWLSQQSQQEKLHHSAANFRSLPQPPANRASAPLVQGDGLIGPYISQAEGYRSSIWASDVGQNELNSQINSALAKAINQTRTVRSNDRQETAASALSTAATEITEILNQNR